MEKNKITKINEAKEIIADLKVSDLKDKELAVVLTKLKIILDDTFNLIKIKKYDNYPVITENGDI